MHPTVDIIEDVELSSVLDSKVYKAMTKNLFFLYIEATSETISVMAETGESYVGVVVDGPKGPSAEPRILNRTTLKNDLLMHKADIGKDFPLRKAA